MLFILIILSKLPQTGDGLRKLRKLLKVPLLSSTYIPETHICLSFCNRRLNSALVICFHIIITDHSIVFRIRAENMMLKSLRTSSGPYSQGKTRASAAIKNMPGKGLHFISPSSFLYFHVQRSLQLPSVTMAA